ncbi:A disintegrin and metalloproteinase with thrombospondin motifs 16-like [Liolophura sinensis]|uniref:A disintegrin and metalloproteinase with thrombospondin motifs 16-like n=1 Tax=Liolophura sinensis TaxID=3198878 RepID=UPI00315859BB
MRQVTGTWRELLQPCYLLVNCILWTGMSSFKSGMASPSKLSPIRLDGRFVIKDYDIVYPVFVGGGETTLTGHPDEGHLKRHRRSTDTRTSEQFRPQPTSHLNISGLGQTFLVKLEPNSGLLAPGFQVYYRSNGSVLSRTWPQGSAFHTDHTDGSRPAGHVPRGGDCLYRGDIISHRSSRAAFSMCGGHVLGMLMTEEEDYVIEPVPTRQRIPTPLSQQTIPHVMYRASSLRQRPRHYESRGCESDTFLSYQCIYSQYQSGRPHRAAALEWPFDRRRRKRAAFKLSRGLTAELLVVADKSMYHAHKSDDVIMYILSIMNIVSQLYKDSSLGTTIKITLVGLVIMQTDEPKLSINYHAGQTLQNFCQWQSGVTGTYGKHDHAVLLTSLDICSHKNQPCDTLGVTPIKGYHVIVFSVTGGTRIKGNYVIVFCHVFQPCGEDDVIVFSVTGPNPVERTM